jgi:site-specific recombinase XerD
MKARRSFGSFKTKTQARDFYEKAKQEQKSGRFFPERYQHGGYDLVADTIDRYLTTNTTKKAADDEKYFAAWWKARFEGKRLNAITAASVEAARQDILSRKVTPQRVNRYVAWLRHVLNVAIRDGKLSSNPITSLKMYKEPSGKTRYLSLDDERKLLTAIGPTYGPWARLAILTDLRQMEQFSLKMGGLRHTFASRLAMEGQSESTIATLLRHSSTAQVRRSRISVRRTCRPPWKAWPALDGRNNRR